MNNLAKNCKWMGALTPVKFAICATFISGSVCAASYTWSGAGGDNDFKNPLNYVGGDEAGFVVPGSGDTLAIPAGNTITLEYDTADATTVLLLRWNPR